MRETVSTVRSKLRARRWQRWSEVEPEEDWLRWARAFDLFNLGGLLAGAAPGSRRAADVRSRIVETLADLP